VLRLPHGGLARARNAGIAAATGQYLCALDADDLLNDTFLEKAVALLEVDASLTFVSCWLEAFQHESWLWKPRRCDLTALLAECTVCTAAVVRLPAVRAVSGFDESMPEQGYEDWDLWLSLVERGYAGTIIPEVLFRYRRVPGSMSIDIVSPAVHRRLMEYLVTKHAASYRLHMKEILQLQDDAIGELLRSNQHQERHISTLERDVQQRTIELTRLEAKMRSGEDRGEHTARAAELARSVESLERELERHRDRLAQLNDAVEYRTREIEALRQSKSWRVTAPLRALYGIVLALTSPRPSRQL
jgi:hypothetical protein